MAVRPSAPRRLVFVASLCAWTEIGRIAPWILLLLAIAPRAAVGQLDSESGGQRRPGSLGSNAATAPPKLLVLKNGRVVEGSIRADRNGYQVSTPRSNLFFTFEQVRFAAADINEAYRKMADSIPDRTQLRDMTLGRWCLENGLQREAAIHLREVLKVDATNRDAKQLLSVIEGANPDGAGERSNHQRQSGAQAESIARIAPSAVREYVTAVQPVLLSRCGSAACHGSQSTTSFTLEHVRLGGNRAVSARNLSAILDQIDSRFPSRSLLLEKGFHPHGELGRAPFAGRAAPEQEARLRRWVQSVAPDLARVRREQTARSIIGRGALERRGIGIHDPHVVPASGRMDAARPDGVSDDAQDASTDGRPHGQAGAANAARRARPAGPRLGEWPPGAGGAAAKDLGPLTDPFDPAAFSAGQPHQR